MAEQITHEGIVEQVTEGRVRVRIVQTAACSACKAKSMCTASETAVKVVDAEPITPLQVGDRVIIEVSRKLGWKAVLLAFILPFLLLLLCVWALPHWIESEAVVGTLAIGSLVPYYLILHAFDKKLQKEYRFTARLA